MSPVTEAQELFCDNNSDKYPFYGIIYIQTRRVGKVERRDILTEESEKILSNARTMWWDNKMSNESLYASGPIERFKQDQLPIIIKKLL